MIFHVRVPLAAFADMALVVFLEAARARVTP
jgi:hypothetical protein